MIGLGKFYITTPIYYINDVPSIGHAYTTTIADILARWHRIQGDKVFFLTGLDENSGKTVKAAHDKGFKDVMEYTDEMAKKWKSAWKEMDISNDSFIRTTQKSHHKVVKEIFMKMYKKGDIYKGRYEGLYCEGCEAYLTEKDLVDGLCQYHKKPPKQISEENYFFKLSSYRDKILDYVKKHPEFVQPATRQNEVISFLEGDVKDISVTRPDLELGIPVPIDKKQKIWIWVDALGNYISGAHGNWPADVHLIAKDILRFHCVIWPAILMSAGYKMPKTVFVHGFLTINGQKISKSLGNVINPIHLKEKYGVDAVRYYIAREIPFGGDGDFNEKALVERINNELANELGNLLNRTIVMLEKYCEGKIPKAKTNSALQKTLNAKKIRERMDAFEFHEALNETFSFVGACNKFINDREPWKQQGKALDETLYSLADSLRIISILVSPFMPQTSGRINAQLGVKSALWKDIKFNLLKPGTKTKKGEVLFQKMKFEEKIEKARKVKVAVDTEVSGLGLKVFSAIVENAKIKNKHSGLEREKKDAAEKTDLSSPEANNLIREYENVYEKLGVSGVTNSVRNLVEQVKVQGKLPQINTAVDSYNLVSLRRKVVVGAHDINKLLGDIRFKIYDGKKPYTPLGSHAEREIPAGGFSVEDDREVICWLDEKQCDNTKVDNGTKHIVLYVQGNNAMSDDYCRQALKEICEKITQYCGGTWKEL